MAPEKKQKFLVSLLISGIVRETENLLKKEEPDRMDKNF